MNKLNNKVINKNIENTNHQYEEWEKYISTGFNGC